jgi:hypothetical protein
MNLNGGNSDFNSQLFPDSPFGNRPNIHYFHNPCSKSVELDTTGTKIIPLIFVKTKELTNFVQVETCKTSIRKAPS